MIIARHLIADEVIVHKMTELQVQLLEALMATHTTGTDYLIDNNQSELATADEERVEIIKANVEQLAKNQKNRIINISYYERQIEFLQSILAKTEGFIEIDERVKELIYG